MDDITRSNSLADLLSRRGEGIGRFQRINPIANQIAHAPQPAVWSADKERQRFGCLQVRCLHASEKLPATADEHNAPTAGRLSFNAGTRTPHAARAGATPRRHHPNPAEAHRRWRGERSEPVRLGVRSHTHALFAREVQCKLSNGIDGSSLDRARSRPIRAPFSAMPR
jgi:hypothetical protein